METKPWYQSKTVIAGIGSGLAGLAFVLKFFFKVDIADQVPVLTSGLLGVLTMVGSVVVIYGRCTAKTVIAPSDSPTKSINVAIVALLLPAVLGLTSCAQGPVYPASPVAKTAADLQIDFQNALQVYADARAGNADFVYAIEKASYAYADYIQTSGDIKALIKAWTGDPGASQKLADRLARIFAASPLDAATKTTAIAVAAQKVAEAKG